jgi:phytoene/squalene synthetase
MTPSEIALKEETLESIRDTIEKLSKQQHIQVLQILRKYPNIRLNENRNGVYINLSYVPDIAIDELSRYILYVNDQEQNLATVELQKQEFQRTFFS